MDDFASLEDELAAAEDGYASIKVTRRREESEMDITPMIDITFLLLIFFLVASKMDQSADVKLPPAKYGAPVPMKNSVVVTVDKGTEDGPAAVYKGNTLDAGSLIDARDLAALEQEVADYVQGELLEHPEKNYLLIKAAKGVKHREVSRVAKAASRVAEVQQLHVAVLEAQ